MSDHTDKCGCVDMCWFYLCQDHAKKLARIKEAKRKPKQKDIHIEREFQILEGKTNAR